jgi:hypothetical protein
MRITQIKVKSGGRFPHPHERFSNLEAEVELTAEPRASDLSSDEDFIAAVRALQIQADALYAQHRQQRCDAIMAAVAALRNEPYPQDPEEIDRPF